MSKCSANEKAVGTKPGKMMRIVRREEGRSNCHCMTFDFQMTPNGISSVV